MFYEREERREERRGEKERKVKWRDRRRGKINGASKEERG